MSNIIYKKELITTEKAKQYLDNMGTNRKPTRRNILFLLNEMKTGNWRETGDGIKFDSDGKLMDGQHRLLALIQYGKALEFLVIRGLKKSSFEVLDTGKSRTASDILSIQGYKNTNNMAAAIKWVELLQTKSVSAKQKEFFSNSRIKKFADANPDLEEIISWAHVDIYRQFRFMPASFVGALYYVVQKKNQSKADSFFEKYANGIGLKPDSPILALRDRLIKDSDRKSKLSIQDKAALFIMAWNHYITNKPVTNLMLAKNYQFPYPL
jgi:hypothetical protein